MGTSVERAHGRTRVGLPHGPQQRRRIRVGHLAKRIMALLGQRQRLVNAGR